jgi:hypothetical protein
MDPDRIDALLRPLSIAPSRRVTLTLLAGAALGGPLPTGAKKRGNKKKVKVCHQGKTIKIRKSAKASHLSHGDSAGDCPPPIDAGCPGPPDLSTSSFPDPAQFAQTFLAPRSGVLISARCEVRNFAEEADFTLEIRPVDPLTAEPTEDVLASAALPNRPATGSEPLPLEAAFTPPAPVEEGDGYALVVTMTGTEGSFSLMALGGNPCPGTLFVLNDEGEFETIGADMTFSATIV